MLRLLAAAAALTAATIIAIGLIVVDNPTATNPPDPHNPLRPRA